MLIPILLKSRGAISARSTETPPNIFRICKKGRTIALALFCCLTTACLSVCSVVSFAENGVMKDTASYATEEQSFKFRSLGRMELDEAISQICEELVQQANIIGKPLLINPNDLYEAKTGLSLPLAILLRGKLIEEMKSQGVRVLLPGVDETRHMILQGSWQKEGEDLGLNLKVLKLFPHGPEAMAAASAQVPLNKIDGNLLVPDREAWARYLLRKLEQNTPSTAQWKVNVSPFKIHSGSCNPNLGHYLTGWIQPALSHSNMFMPLDQKRALRNLSVKDLRKRGTRAIRPNVSKTDNGVDLLTDLMGADAELKGEAWLHKKKVEVRVRVVSTKKNQHLITAASVDVPLHLFPHELLEPQPKTQQASGSGATGIGQGISKDGLVLELTTTAGQGKVFYHGGEHIRFVLRLNRTAEVYVFNLAPDGTATLLYPVDGDGRLARGGTCRAFPAPGTPLIIPGDGCAYDLKVTKPYGRDTVWAVASETPLSLPSHLNGDWQNANILIKRVRKQGLIKKGGYAESKVEIVTGSMPQ